MRKILFALFVILLAGSSNAKALYADTVFVKLGRGITNIVTAPLEIVVQPFRVALVDKRVDLALPAGLPQGIYYTAARILTGAYDVVTFPFPVPAEYRPVFHPSTVFEAARAAETGKWQYPSYGFGEYQKPDSRKKPGTQEEAEN